MSVRRAVRSNLFHAVLFVFAGLHHRFGVFWYSGNNQCCLWNGSNVLEKRSVQCDRSSEWAGISASFFEHLQYCRNGVSAFEPVCVEWIWSIVKLQWKRSLL